MTNISENPNEDAERKFAIKEKRRKYYENNRYAICDKTINSYCASKIKKVRGLCIGRVNEYMVRYPFEKYADRYIKRQLSIYKVKPSDSRYADCYDAGMMAYLYSIHRCAEMSYSHTEPYIKKLVRIYIICALVVYDDTRNLCQANGFREVRLDAEASFDRY